MANNKKNIWAYSMLALIVFQTIIVNIDVWFWLKIVFSSCVYALVMIYLFSNTRAKIKEYNKAMIQASNRVRPSATTLLDVYAILKIAPQYNPDGSLKDMYQLLGIIPEYGENGKRIPTIYERLGINPKFSIDGQELPYVLRIKNRVNSLVKPEQSTLPLVYVPRGKQRIEQPILPEPQEKPKDEKIEFNKTTVVKVQTKKSPQKPAKEPAPNYGAAGKAISYKAEKFKHNGVVMPDTGGYIKLFDIVKNSQVSKTIEKVAEKMLEENKPKSPSNEPHGTQNIVEPSKANQFDKIHLGNDYINPNGKRLHYGEENELELGG